MTRYWVVSYDMAVVLDTWITRDERLIRRYRSINPGHYLIREIDEEEFTLYKMAGYDDVSAEGPWDGTG